MSHPALYTRNSVIACSVVMVETLQMRGIGFNKKAAQVFGPKKGDDEAPQVLGPKKGDEVCVRVSHSAILSVLPFSNCIQL